VGVEGTPGPDGADAVRQEAGVEVARTVLRRGGGRQEGEEEDEEVGDEAPGGGRGSAAAVDHGDAPVGGWVGGGVGGPGGTLRSRENIRWYGWRLNRGCLP